MAWQQRKRKDLTKLKVTSRRSATGRYEQITLLKQAEARKVLLAAKERQDLGAAAILNSMGYAFRLCDYVQ